MNERFSIAGYLIVALTILAGCDVSPEAELEQIEALLGPAPIAAIADIGAGSGDQLAGYSRMAGEEGTVYATEIDPTLLRTLDKRVTADGLDNVLIVEATVTSTGLSAGCCELVVLRHVYHHLADPVAILADIHTALRPGGRLLLIDFKPTWLLAPWTPDELPDDRTGHGVTPELMVREAAVAGFRRLSVEDDWPGSHFLMDRFAVLLERME